MKKITLITSLILGLIFLYNCKKEKKTEPKPQTELNQQTAQAIAPSVADGFRFLILTMFKPDEVNISPFKRNGINQDPCETRDGDFSDGDSDGYYRDAKITYNNCTVSYPPYTYIFSGTIEIKDKNDNDATSGFYLKFSDYEFKFIHGDSTLITVRSNSVYDIDKVGTSFSGHIEYDYAYITKTEVSWSTHFDFNYIPDNPSDPWVAGVLNFDGNSEFKYAGITYALKFIGEDLHFNEYSDCEYPDRGKIKVTDGTNYLTITYYCNYYTADYNGTPISKTR
ncbi:MAG: hypothetical protein ABDH37_01615 [Candidatus Hydrothermales bacterium]